MGLLVFLTAWLPMVLWAFGVIERYVLALALSIGFGLAALAGGILWLRRRVKLAVENITNQPG